MCVRLSYALCRYQIQTLLTQGEFFNVKQVKPTKHLKFSFDLPPDGPSILPMKYDLSSAFQLPKHSIVSAENDVLYSTIIHENSLI